MKRIIVALAMAGLSLSAFALPPPGSGAPLNVSVTNTPTVIVGNTLPVPVAPQQAYTPIGKLRRAVSHVEIETGGIETQDAVVMGSALPDMVATGVIASISTMRATAASGTTTCFSSLYVRDNSTGAVAGDFFAISAAAGEEKTLYIPLPNVYIPPNHNIVTTSLNYTDAACIVDYSIQIEIP